MFEKSKFQLYFLRFSHTWQNLNTKARHRISFVLVVYSFRIIVPALYKVAAYALPSVHKGYINNKMQHLQEPQELQELHKPQEVQELHEPQELQEIHEPQKLQDPQ